MATRPKAQKPRPAPRPAPVVPTKPNAAPGITRATPAIAIAPVPVVEVKSTSPKKKEELTLGKKMGAGSLTISVIFHAILLILAAFLILKIVPKNDPVVDFMPNGGGGGSPGEKISQRKRAMVNPVDISRVAAQGVTSNFTLPPPDNSSMASVGALSSGGISGGLGGSGSGGGRGDGKGTGFGSGMGPGLGGGNGNANPFGMLDPNANGLVGVFYDTKQDTKRKDTGIDSSKIHQVLINFTTRGWDQKTLSTKYYQAPHKLSQTRVFMPMISADVAPAAFGCDKEVKGKHWIVVYRGTVIAPKSGKFRFVGAADDALVVRFNRQNVFDYGFRFGSVEFHINSKSNQLIKGGNPGKELESQLKRAKGIEYPIAHYQYDTTPTYNQALGGLAIGPQFEVRANSSYPIEILISEVPGGNFGAILLIEEMGADYKTTSGGAPILPIFRTDSTLPEAKGANLPPFDPNSPIWRVVPGSGLREI
jgi:hypothetical protein